jgi:hypothetical protein
MLVNIELKDGSTAEKIVELELEEPVKLQILQKALFIISSLIYTSIKCLLACVRIAHRASQKQKIVCFEEWCLLGCYIMWLL